MLEDLLKPKKKPVNIKPRRIIKTDNNGVITAIININAPEGMFSTGINKNTFDVSNNPMRDELKVGDYEVKNGKINKLDRPKKTLDELA